MRRNDQSHQNTFFWLGPAVVGLALALAFFTAYPAFPAYAEPGQGPVGTAPRLLPLGQHTPDCTNVNIPSTFQRVQSGALQPGSISAGELDRSALGGNGAVLAFECGYSVDLSYGGPSVFGKLLIVTDYMCTPTDAVQNRQLHTENNKPIPVSQRTDTTVTGSLGPFDSEDYLGYGWQAYVGAIGTLVRPYAFAVVYAITNWEPQASNHRLLQADAFVGMATELAQANMPTAADMQDCKDSSSTSNSPNTSGSTATNPPTTTTANPMQGPIAALVGLSCIGLLGLAGLGGIARAVGGGGGKGTVSPPSVKLPDKPKNIEPPKPPPAPLKPATMPFQPDAKPPAPIKPSARVKPSRLPEEPRPAWRPDPEQEGLPLPGQEGVDGGGWIGPGDRERELRTRQGYIWDPQRQEWRYPTPDERPQPDVPGAAQDQTPTQQRMPRKNIPGACLGQYDNVVQSEARSQTLLTDLNWLREQQDRAERIQVQNRMKAIIILGIDMYQWIDSLASGAQDAKAAAERSQTEGLGVKENWKPGGEGDWEPPRGIRSGLLELIQAADERLRRTLQRIKDLKAEIADLEQGVASGQSRARNLAELADGAAHDVADLESKLKLPGKMADLQRRVQRLEEATAANGKFLNAEAASTDSSAKASAAYFKMEEAKTNLETGLQRLQREQGQLLDARDRARMQGNSQRVAQLTDELRQIDQKENALQVAAQEAVKDHADKVAQLDKATREQQQAFYEMQKYRDLAGHLDDLPAAQQELDDMQRTYGNLDSLNKQADDLRAQAETARRKLETFRDEARRAQEQSLALQQQLGAKQKDLEGAQVEEALNRQDQQRLREQADTESRNRRDLPPNNSGGGNPWKPGWVKSLEDFGKSVADAVAGAINRLFGSPQSYEEMMNILIQGARNVSDIQEAVTNAGRQYDQEQQSLLELRGALNRCLTAHTYWTPTGGGGQP